MLKINLCRETLSPAAPVKPQSRTSSSYTSFMETVVVLVSFSRKILLDAVQISLKV